MFLQLVVEGVQGRDLDLQTLADTALVHNAVGERAVLQRVAGEHLPVVEDALRERLSTGVRPEVRREAERLGHGQVRAHVVDRGTRPVLLSEHDTTTLVQHTVDTAHRVLDGLDVHQEDRLHERRLGGQAARVVHTARRRDDLTTSTVDSVRVHRDVLDVDAHTTHRLLAEHTLLRGPVPRRHERVLQLRHVLHTLRHVDDDVRARAVRSEAPDLPGLSDVPVELVRERTGTDLGVSRGVHVAVLSVDLLAELLRERRALAEQPVVLVRRLRQALPVRDVRDRLTERHDRLGDLQLGARHVVLLKVLQADLKVELTGTGDDVLSRLLDGALHKRVGLRQTLQTLHQLRQVRRRRALDGHTHDRRHAVLHVTERVAVRARLVRDRRRLHDEAVDTDQTHDVTARHVLDGLLVPAHHEERPLDVLHRHILLGAVLVVGAHDARLLAGLHLTREHTAERDETALVRGGNHLGDVHHQRGGGVALPQTLVVLVVVRDERAVLLLHQAHVQLVRTVALRRPRGRELRDNHLQERVGRRQELLHDALQQLLLRQLLLVTLQHDVERLHHLLHLVLLLVHHGVEQVPDRLHAELAEGTLGAVRGLGRPLLPLAVEVRVSPQTLHHLVLVHAELRRVHLRELVQREGPRVQTGSESDRARLRVHLHVAELLVVVRGDHDVHRLDRPEERLVRLLGVQLELEQGTVDLVHHHDRLDALGQGLAQHGLRLHAHTLDAVDNHEGTVRHTEGGRHLGREVNVSRRVDQVDKEVPAVVTRHLLQLRVVDERLRDVVVQRDRRRLDRDATLLLVRTRVRQTRVTGLRHGDDTGGGHKRVRQRGLAVVNVGNHGHVTDLVGEVHDLTDLVNGEVHHLG
eukprot:Rhum_TRINITY_DN14106_c0_g1::Rhum_TRINITY_DN14106_c0_g1_i1::g.69326::m.69326